MNSFCGLVCQTKDTKSYFQVGPLSKILTMTDPHHVAGSIWISVEPELRLCLMKLYSSDNHYTMLLQGLLHPKKPFITDLWKFISIESQIHANVRKVVNISGHCYMMPKRDLLKAHKTKWLANFTCIDLKWI